MNITKPFKLKTLFIDEYETLQFESLELLLQKSGDYLENFGFISDEIDEIDENIESTKLLKLIIKYCKKIKFLDLPELNGQNLNTALSLIENIKQSLNYLSINCYYFELSSVILRDLGQVLPSELEYLNLCLTFYASDFKVFFRKFSKYFY
ncbi:hypothetical protein C1645_415545 [Glomus cerebriforme]|uniref:SKP1 component POZ domain-containing protein n=1 Tax=Glomus cerebriforme TaxID=658196 RepID=A0A397SIG6_9GLOM|nr:hypothetical protein C1645_415545 [Glomus cerebriforme]